MFWGWLLPGGHLESRQDLWQKREKQAPWVGPAGDAGWPRPCGGIPRLLGYWLCAAGAWLALVISVGTTFLLYRLIARGNLVNVSSLFYLVRALQPRWIVYFWATPCQL
jgi:hypothetical protein